MALPLTLQGCAAIVVADAAAGATYAVGKTAVNGTVGATKLVARGVGATVNAVKPNRQPQDLSGYDCHDQPDGQRVCYQQ